MKAQNKTLTRTLDWPVTDFALGANIRGCAKQLSADPALSECVEVAKREGRKIVVCCEFFVGERVRSPLNDY